jgi:PTH1 family peptidyl-tRNA hydrolase
MTHIRLIVGLGNPGSSYQETRHNAGFWFVDALAKKHNLTFTLESKFFGLITKLRYQDQDVFLLKPQTYMNLSGKSIQALAGFYKIQLQQILVVHDELDFIPGVVKLKLGGGNGGHNGLKDIDRLMGKDYWRLRLGIGHPGDKHKVADYVLNRPSVEDKIAIELAIDKGILVIDSILNGQFEQAIKVLHTR